MSDPKYKNLYCVFVGPHDYNMSFDDPTNVEVGFWELEEFATEDACNTYLWERASGDAESWGDPEEDQEWSEFVDETMSYGFIKFDENVEQHMALWVHFNETQKEKELRKVLSEVEQVEKELDRGLQRMKEMMENRSRLLENLGNLLERKATLEA